MMYQFCNFQLYVSFIYRSDKLRWKDSLNLVLATDMPVSTRCVKLKFVTTASVSTKSYKMEDVNMNKKKRFVLFFVSSYWIDVYQYKKIVLHLIYTDKYKKKSSAHLFTLYSSRCIVSLW